LEFKEGNTTYKSTQIFTDPDDDDDDVIGRKFRALKEVILRSQWPHSLRRGSVAAGMLRLWVRIPQGAWMSVCCKCCVLSGRGLCDELITRPEESYRMWCVVVCDLETSCIRRPWPTGGCWVKRKKYGNNFGVGKFRTESGDKETMKRKERTLKRAPRNVGDFSRIL